MKHIKVISILSIFINLVLIAYIAFNKNVEEYKSSKHSHIILEKKFETNNKLLNELRKEHLYLLKLILKDGISMKKHMPEYSNVSNEDFEEGIRQKVVELKMQLQIREVKEGEN